MSSKSEDDKGGRLACRADRGGYTVLPQLIENTTAKNFVIAKK